MNMAEFKVIESTLKNTATILRHNEAIEAIVKSLAKTQFIQSIIAGALGATIVENVLYEKKTDRVINDLKNRVEYLEMQNR